MWLAYSSTFNVLTVRRKKKGKKKTHVPQKLKCEKESRRWNNTQAHSFPGSRHSTAKPHAARSRFSFQRSFTTTPALAEASYLREKHNVSLYSLLVSFSNLYDSSSSSLARAPRRDETPTFKLRGRLNMFNALWPLLCCRRGNG